MDTLTRAHARTHNAHTRTYICTHNTHISTHSHTHTQLTVYWIMGLLFSRYSYTPHTYTYNDTVNMCTY